MRFTRPKDMEWNEACVSIRRELRAKGKRPSSIQTQGLTDENGNVIYEVVVK